MLKTISKLELTNINYAIISCDLEFNESIQCTVAPCTVRKSIQKIYRTVQNRTMQIYIKIVIIFHQITALCKSLLTVQGLLRKPH